MEHSIRVEWFMEDVSKLYDTASGELRLKDCMDFVRDIQSKGYRLLIDKSRDFVIDKNNYDNLYNQYDEKYTRDNIEVVISKKVDIIEGEVKQNQNFLYIHNNDNKTTQIFKIRDHRSGLYLLKEMDRIFNPDIYPIWDEIDPSI